MRLDELNGLSPSSKTITFTAEKNGEPINIDFYVYPFTVKEKIELQKLQKDLKNKSEDEKDKASLDMMRKIIYMILSKSINDLSIKDVDSIPHIWYDDLISAALEFEGISKDKIDQFKKKEMDLAVEQLTQENH